MPIMFGGLVTKKKTVDKYLGDMFYGDGLEASVDATIDDRIVKIKASTFLDAGSGVDNEFLGFVEPSGGSKPPE